MKNFERLKGSVEAMVLLGNGLDEEIPDWAKTVAIDIDGGIYAYEREIDNFYGIWMPVDYGKYKYVGLTDPVSEEESKKLKFNISRV